MTNKKFKLAAMSLALTACVAASPLAANAESADAEVNKPASTTATSTDETKQDTTNENDQKATDNNEQDAANNNEQNAADNNEKDAADKNEQDAANNNEQDAANNNEQDAANKNEQDAANKNEQDAANKNEQDAANKNEQDAANKNEQDAANKNEQDAANNNEQDAANNNEQDAANNNEQNAANNNEQNAANKNEQDAANNNEQDAANKNEQDAANNNEQGAANNNEQDAANNNEQNAANNNEQNAANNNEQNAADNNEQDAADNNEQNAADVNGVPAAAKAPVLMLAKAPAAPTGTPTTPTEDNTVATITRQDGTTTTTTKYTSFDEAVSKANNGDTIEVIKDATSTGIDLQNKKLTIKGKTVTTTTDSGTEENKPKLKFVAKEGQPQIVGITLLGSNLTFQNMDVDMTGASSTTYNNWNAVCMSGDAALTLKSTDLFMNGKGLDERKDQKILKPHGIYMAGRGRNELNVDDHSTLTINNYYNAIAWDGVGNEDSIYYINIKNGSTFTADGNEAGIVGLESLDVLVEDSTMTITNCRARYPDKTDNRVLPNEHEGRSGLNGADVTITRSNVTISGCEQGYGIHTRDLHVENSTLTTDNNGYSSIFITGKGEFINSTINARGNTGLGNDTIEITRYPNETGIGYHYGSLKVTNSTLNITNNNATGIRCNFGDLNIDDASRVTVQYNKATDDNGYNRLYGLGGGLVVRRGTTAKLGANTTINNNSAALEGADIFIQPGGTLTFSVGNAGIGDILNKGPEDADCGHKIDGWYIDANGSRWNFDADADSAQAFLDSLDELPEGVTVNYDSSTGLYTITVAKTAEDGFALKAAHAELPAPTPDPDGPDTPTPNPNPNPNPKPEPKPGPDTSITPEDPQLPPVQDARADDTPDSPVLPSSPTNPAVQDAHALPQTGTSLFAALAMALSGFALTIAGAWASLLGKNSRH
ncbi:hypothetical protein WF834_11530 [Faecalibacterium sp. HTF-128]|uniref:Right handed beta helix domain-containing protein n=1 Tax=Faecalibacterium wellingii TaxID=2929491 RepID=A0AB35Y838_9FIRM